MVSWDLLSLAGVAAGVYSDPVAGSQQCLRVAKTFTPRVETAERYNALFELFKDLHDGMQAPYDRIGRNYCTGMMQ